MYRREIRQILHPRSVNVVRLDGRVVDEKILHTVMIFLGSYMLITFGATLLVALDNFSFGTTFTAVVACIGNIGPGLELARPHGQLLHLFSSDEAGPLSVHDRGET